MSTLMEKIGLIELRNPINTCEFKHDARIILGALHRNDPEQFKSFLNNSNLTHPNFLEDR